MEQKAVLVIVSLVIGVSAVSLTATRDDKLDHDKIVSCYYSSWAFYRNGLGKFDVEDIDPFLCTHGFYGFADLDNITWTIYVYDPWFDLAPEDCEPGFCKFDGYRRFVGLRNVNPNFKAMLSVGGWNAGSGKYSMMAADPEKRRSFIDSSIALLTKYGFDGLDLDWEYPGYRNGTDPEEDKANFNILVEEFNNALKAQGFLFTAALGCGYDKVMIAYDVPYISERFDFINLMGYDFNGAWNNFTGHNSPLYPRDEEDFVTFPTYRYNLYDSVELYLELGAPREKLVLGLPTYGRGFELAIPEDNGLFCPTERGFPPGPYTRQRGHFGYLEVLQLFFNESYNENFPDATPGEWVTVIDDCYASPYIYNGPYWLGYDDPDSFAIKTRFANFMGLGGIMVWSVETDDFLGEYGPVYPLLNTINEELSKGETFDPANPKCQGTAPVCYGDLVTTPPTSTTTTDQPDTTTPDLPALCTEHMEVFPYPGDCQKYFMCLQQQGGDGFDVVIYHCASCEFFNPNTHACDGSFEQGAESLCRGQDGIFDHCPKP